MNTDLAGFNRFRWERSDYYAGAIENRQLKLTHASAALMEDRDNKRHVLFVFIDVQGSGSAEHGAANDRISRSALDRSFDQHEVESEEVFVAGHQACKVSLGVCADNLYADAEVRAIDVAIAVEIATERSLSATDDVNASGSLER